MLLSKVDSGSIIQKCAVDDLTLVKLPKTNDFLDYLLKKQTEFGKKWIPFGKFKNNDRLRIPWILDNLQTLSNEVAELFTWLPWAYWQDHPDYSFQKNEFKYELIDVLHFVFTGMAIVGLTPDRIIKCYEKLLAEKGEKLSYVGNERFSVFFKFQGRLEKKFLEPIDSEQKLLIFLQGQIITLVYQIEVIREFLPWKHWKTYEGYVYPEEKVQVAYVDLLTCLVSSMITLGVDISEAIKIYESKHQQNLIRQERKY
jgi:hypothetical protein